MNIKKWIINPCNKCLVYACCTQPCIKLETFMKKQSIIWLLSGFIIITPILIFFIYLLYYLLTYPIILTVFIVVYWLSAGFWFYKEILKTDNDNIFITIFSFIWLPYVVFSVFIGMVLGLTFTRKENAQFLTGDIWKKEIK